MTTSKRIFRLFEGADHSRTELSAILGIRDQRLQDIFDGSSPTLQEIIAIQKAFRVSLSWLMGEEVDLFDAAYSWLVDAKVEAGFVKGPHDPQMLERLDMYFLPGFQGSDNFIFEVKGHSMLPLIAEGDYLVGSEVTDFRDLPENGLGIILLSDELLVKRVDGVGDELLLKSENPDERVLRVNKKDVKAFWKVLGMITREFVYTTKRDFLRKLEMGRELELLWQEFGECQQELYKTKQTLAKGRG